MKKILLLLILIFSMIFNTACWDMIEVNNRIFPYSIGVDLNHKEDGKEFLVNFSYPNINAIGSEASSDIKSFLMVEEGNNIFDAISNLGNRIQHPIYLKHLKVFIVSEEVARNPKLMKDIIDGLDREFIMNKMIDLLVVKNSTKEFTETKIDATRQESVSGSLNEILRNEQRSTQFTPKSLNEFIKNMDYSSTSSIPVGMKSEESTDIVISGGAIFKDYGLIGYVNEDENRDIAILNGATTQSETDINFHDHNLSVIMTNIKSKKKLVDKDPMKIKFNIRTEGQIHQYVMEDGLSDEESDKLLGEMESKIKESMENDLNKTINKLQKDLNADVLEISEYLSKFHPHIWDLIKDDWDNIYPNINIEVSVEIHIRRRGLTR